MSLCNYVTVCAICVSITFSFWILTFARLTLFALTLGGFTDALRSVQEADSGGLRGSVQSDQQRQACSSGAGQKAGRGIRPRREGFHPARSNSCRGQVSRESGPRESKRTRESVSVWHKPFDRVHSVCPDAAQPSPSVSLRCQQLT